MLSWATYLEILTAPKMRWQSSVQQPPMSQPEPIKPAGLGPVPPPEGRHAVSMPESSHTCGHDVILEHHVML